MKPGHGCEVGDIETEIGGTLRHSERGADISSGRVACKRDSWSLAHISMWTLRATNGGWTEAWADTKEGKIAR